MTVDEEIKEASTFFMKAAWQTGVYPGSVVAGIRDVNGGFRVVVGPHEGMVGHLTDGEKLFILPEIIVAEPVPHGHVSSLIDLVNRYMQQKETQ